MTVLSFAPTHHVRLPAAPPRIAGQAARYTSIGVAGTLVSLVLLQVLQLWTTLLLANVVSWLITTLVTNEAQRRIAFGGDHRIVTTDVLLGLGSSAGALIATSAALTVLPATTTVQQLAAVLLANGVAGAVRFAVLHAWYGRHQHIAR